MTPITAEAILSALRAQEMRITGPRRKIIDVLLESDTPISMQEIHDQASKSGDGPDFATVYRVVNLLENLGFAHKMQVGRREPYYELSDRHNDHLVCTSCGKFFPIDDCPVPVAMIEKAHNFKVESHSLIMYGKCADCRD